jgi:hypothetical protein
MAPRSTKQQREAERARREDIQAARKRRRKDPDFEAEQAWLHDMHEQLTEWRRACRDHNWNPRRDPKPEPPNINVRLYEVICSLGERTFGRILPEITANRDALDPIGLRYFLKVLHGRAKSAREHAKHITEQAERRAQYFENLVRQFDDGLKEIKPRKPAVLPGASREFPRDDEK